MANLKNIADLPVVESAEGLNFIVNDNGSAKQIAASAIGTAGTAYVKSEPYVIDSEAYTYGDDALAAILEGRQILVKVPNKQGNTLYSNFMPVLQYQLPDQNNNYLILFYLKDGIAENILAAMQSGSFDGVYGVIEMMLSETYTECPLKVNPVK
jgi:hypothetical protein